jgi:hypothetical protein
LRWLCRLVFIYPKGAQGFARLCEIRMQLQGGAEMFDGFRRIAAR